MAKLIRVTLERSLSKCDDRQIATLQGLGLRRRQHSKVLMDTREIRGMIMKMQHMLTVEAFEGDDSLRQGARRRAAARRGAGGES
jgi:large subunit ribosomal protein L30